MHYGTRPVWDTMDGPPRNHATTTAYHARIYGSILAHYGNLSGTLWMEPRHHHCVSQGLAIFPVSDTGKHMPC